MIQENRSPFQGGNGATTKPSILTESFLKTPTNTYDQANTGLDYSATSPQRLHPT